MKIRPIYNFRFLPRGIEAMVLYPFILFASDKDFYINTRRGEVYLRHELQHVYQVERNWYLGFYIMYGLKWLRNLFKYRSVEGAYLAISYEAEARHYENDALTIEEWSYFL